MAGLLGRIRPYQGQITHAAQQAQRYRHIDAYTQHADQRRQQRILARIERIVQREVNRGEQHADHIDIERRRHLYRIRRQEAIALE